MVGTLILNVMVLIKRQILGDKTSPLILKRGVTTMAKFDKFCHKVIFSLPLRTVQTLQYNQKNQTNCYKFSNICSQFKPIALALTLKSWNIQNIAACHFFTAVQEMSNDMLQCFVCSPIPKVSEEKGATGQSFIRKEITTYRIVKCFKFLQFF